MNPAYKPPELLKCLNNVQVKALVCAEYCDYGSCYDAMLQLIPELTTCSGSDVRCSFLPALRTLILMGDQKHP